MLTIERGHPLFAVNPITSKFAKPTKNTQKQKKEIMIERRHPFFADSDRVSSEILECLQEFRENLLDDEVPEYRDSHVSFSHEVSSESTSKKREDVGKHSVYIHFHEKRNYEIYQRTKIARVKTEDAMTEPYLVQRILLT